MILHRHAMFPLLVWTAAACGGANPTPQPAADMEALEGRIMLTGSEPTVMITLQPAEGTPVNLTGDYASELRRLSGLVIAVRGTMRGTAPSGMFNVERYEIRSVGGEKPSVGVLALRDGDLWLEGDMPVRLMSPPDGLQSRVGAKVWIVGRPVDGGLHPQSYGVIREP